MATMQQFLEIIHCAKFVMDTSVIGYIITEIFHRWRKDWAQPNAIYTQKIEVLQALGDTTYITNTIAIAILKRSGIDLIEICMLPPIVGAHNV